ncbi:MAG TPA: DUF3618 domain-containing protein [Roseomonas sp.]|jgi:ElaB/YqjD/DUF883 family membrane-anchored ribosome-binding protein
MSGTTTDPGDKSSGQIETEVEQTRANVSGTLDALRGKLAPGQLMDQVVDQVTDYARGSGGAEFARNLGASIRDNPLPVALIGAGIAWLLLSKNGSGGHASSSASASSPKLLPPPDSGSYSGAYVGSMPVSGSGSGRTGTARARISDMVESTQERAGQAAGAASDAMSRATSAVGDAASRVAAAGSDLASSVSDAAGRAAQGLGSLGQQAVGAVGEGLGTARSRASSTTRGASGSFEHLAEAQPLLFGALGLALGAALGAVLPRTQTEDRLLGEARDTVADRVEDAAREGYESVRAAAGEQLERVQESVAATYSETKEQLDRGGLSNAGNTLGKAAGDVTRVAGEALREVAEGTKRSIAEAGEPKERPHQG